MTKRDIPNIIYYRLWAYLDLIHMVMVIPLGFLLMVYGLIRWGKVKGWMAAFLTIFDFTGSMMVGVLLTDMIGLTTPGS